MTLELIKEYDKQGKIIYYVKIDNQLAFGSVRTSLIDAMEVFSNLKDQHSRSRVEVLMTEEIQ